MRLVLLRVFECRVLDAGCGTGVITLALHDAIVRRRFAPGHFHAFDLTPSMLKQFHHALEKRRSVLVETRQADVLTLESLPETWHHYDLIVSVSMLEYLPRDRLADALAALRERLDDNGHLVLFITKRNWLTRPMIGWWWRSNVYSSGELVRAFQRAGFSQATFSAFPLAARYLAACGYIIEARK